jgi:CRISPR/Cas system-associated exonuclease Cas4 (RecB family)
MKIKCPSGEEKEIEYCLECIKCYPSPIKKSLLDGRNRERKDRDKPRFGVTRLTSKCLRKSYFDLTEPPVHSLEKLWIFSRGHAIHNFFQKDMPKEDVEVFKEKNFAFFDLIGFVDAVHDGVLYEFKTTANLPETPQEHHILQAQAYFSMFSPGEQEKINKIIIVYFSLSAIKHFEIPKRNVASFLEGHGTILAQALKSMSPPKKEESWLCNHCEFKELCEKAEKGEYKSSEREDSSSVTQRKLPFQENQVTESNNISNGNLGVPKESESSTRNEGVAPKPSESV